MVEHSAVNRTVASSTLARPAKRRNMKPIKEIEWTWMQRNLYEPGFEKMTEKINEIIERLNTLTTPANEIDGLIEEHEHKT